MYNGNMDSHATHELQNANKEGNIKREVSYSEMYTNMIQFAQQVGETEKLRLLPYKCPEDTDIGQGEDFEYYTVDGPLSFVLQDKNSKVGRIVSFFKGNDPNLLRRYIQTDLDMSGIGANDIVVVQLQGPSKKFGKAVQIDNQDDPFLSFRWEKSLMLLTESYAATHGFSKIHIIPSAYQKDLRNYQKAVAADAKIVQDGQTAWYEKNYGHEEGYVQARLEQNVAKVEQLQKQFKVRYDVGAKRLGYRQENHHAPFTLDLQEEGFTLSASELSDQNDHPSSIELKHFVEKID